MARPTQLDDATQARILAAIEAGCTRATAAKAAGVDGSTFRRWLRKGRELIEPYAELVEQMRFAEARGEAALLAVIREASVRHWTSAAWLLERRFPHRWARRDPFAEKTAREARREAWAALDVIPLEDLEAMMHAERVRRRKVALCEGSG